MALNEIPAPSVARLPRGIVKVGGVVVPGWIEWDTDSNVFSSADTFRVEFAMQGMPAPYDAAWWAAQLTIEVEILGGFPNDPESFAEIDLMSHIVGNVDHVDYNPVQNTLAISGRDKSALLIDTKGSEKFPNQTSSQIATTLAARHGLTPVVTATSTKAGKFYEIDHVTLTDQRSEWDLLTYLANQEGFVVYVKGHELHFEPKPSATSEPYLINWDPVAADKGYPISNVKSLHLSRNLTIAKGITVTVRSWGLKSSKAFSKTWPTKITRSVQPGQASPPAQNYFFTIANLTPDEALKKAQEKYQELIQHEMRLNATLPGDNLVSVTTVLQLQGTGTAFDQIYYPDMIKRHMSIADGYDMTVRAKNMSPGNQPVL